MIEISINIRKRILNRWILISFLFLLNACAASGPIYQHIDIPSPDKARVYIYRPYQFFNAGGWPEIYVDGNELFSLKNEGYGVVILSPGSHVIIKT